MKNNRIIAGILCLALTCGGLLTAISVTGDSGFGHANVINAEPQIIGIDVLDPNWTPIPTLIPGILTYYNVTVRDTDNVSDIKNVTLELAYWSTATPDDPKFYYNFSFDNTTGIWYQTLPSPSNDTYIDALASSVATISNTTANFSFAITLNKTTTDTNGVFKWRVRGAVLDGSGTLTIGSGNLYPMAPFVELSYWGNAGLNDFLWTGTAESNQTIQFNTRITSNDFYWLNASYNGSFQVPWGEPDIWIKAALSGAVQLPDWEVDVPGNVTSILVQLGSISRTTSPTASAWSSRRTSP